MNRSVGALLSLVLAVGLVHGAAAADWSVVQTSGNVVLHMTGAQPVALSSGTTLYPGGVLATGDNSRAMLVRGAEQIVVGPNAVIAIPPGSTDDDFTTILQSAGVVEFTVEKRNVQHFSVETPYLAAVVKGTHFSVGAFGTTGAVRVARGRVEVTALQSGQAVDVLPGQLVEVRSGGGLSLSGQAPFSEILQGSPRFPLLGEGTLAGLGSSGGLSSDVGGILGLGVGGGGGINAEVGGLASVRIGGDEGISANVGGGLVEADVGGGGISVDVGGAVGAEVGDNGISVDVGGLHIGLFGD